MLGSSLSISSRTKAILICHPSIVTQVRIDLHLHLNSAPIDIEIGERAYMFARRWQLWFGTS